MQENQPFTRDMRGECINKTLNWQNEIGMWKGCVSGKEKSIGQFESRLGKKGSEK